MELKGTLDRLRWQKRAQPGGTLSGMFCGACRAEALRMDDELARCKAEVRELKEENQQLRQASDAFGALADRLNSSLREERRKGETDRRSAVRSQPNRRQNTAT